MNLCLLASVLIIATVAPASGINQGCINLGKCKGASAAAIKNDNTDEMCPPIAKQLECVQMNAELCDDANIKGMFLDSLSKLNSTYHKKCVQQMVEGDTGAVMDEAGGCSQLTQCMPRAFLTGLTKSNMTKMCGAIEQNLQCYDTHKDSCEVAAIKQGMSEMVKKLRSHYDEKCNGTGKSGFSLSVLLVSACTVFASIKLLFSR